MHQALQDGYDLANRGINIAISILGDMPSSREISLALTKLDEARLWLYLSETRADMADEAKRNG